MGNWGPTDTSYREGMCYSVVLVCFLTALYFLYAISFPFSLSNPGVGPKRLSLRFLLKTDLLIAFFLFSFSIKFVCLPTQPFLSSLPSGSHTHTYDYLKYDQGISTH